jgi:hypothetical protein
VRQVALWRHEWVPRNMAAALQKAKGSRERARQLLDEARERRLERTRTRGAVEFVSPHPRHRAAAAERAAWSTKSDDDLADELGAADEATVERIVAELDRRDAAARKVEAQRARRAAARHPRDARRSAEFDAACEAGEDAQAAYARIWGVEEERVRRDEAIASMRSSGYKGRGFKELARHAFRDHSQESYLHAEDATSGHLVNKAGAAAGVHPRDLFTGPETRARKYASRELLDHWQEHGRLTLEDFTASLLGGHMRSASTAAWS